MHWLAAAAGIASMTAALERGDLDEVARQGSLAGPAVVEKALASHDRATQLAGIVAAPAVEDRAELLPALARIAAGHDRRTAIPAARAALAIAHAFGEHERPDDIAPGDVETWRASFEHIARADDALVEARVISLEVAHALVPDQLGFDLAALLLDHDPDVALAAAQIACADYRSELAAIRDRVHALASERVAARDVEACLK
ncbi:MAG TPA: hypothetical protein VGG74_16595 [Kofleriaceae bacterium]